LEYALSRLSANTRETLKNSVHFIACSQAVADNLAANRGVNAARIDVVHEFVETRRNLNMTALRKQMRERLQLPQETFVVICGGALEWRKGADWWLQIARMTLQKQAASTRSGRKTDFRFVWIGAAADALYDLELRHEVRRMKLENTAIFPGALPNARDFFAAGDAFLLPSREDPFPLVCLEAAALGMPILCFEEAGGMPEMVQEDAGFLAPYGDCETVSQQLWVLMNDETLRQKLGARAAEKARGRYDVSVGAPQIKSVLERILAAHSKHEN
jgi:glycosyltransferase involved in cell wall biosynthesis